MIARITATLPNETNAIEIKIFCDEALDPQTALPAFLTNGRNASTVKTSYLRVGYEMSVAAR